MPFKKKPRGRLSVLSVIMAAVLLLYSFRIFSLQIFSADAYIEQASGISYRTAVLKAQRGEILDCNGREIAVNREGYNVVLNKAYIDMDSINEVILSLCQLLSENNVPWIDNLPLEKEAPYNFTDKTYQVESLLSNLKLAHYATAENCFDEMVEKYDLAAYDDATKRLLMGIRYSIQTSSFSISNPYTFSEDVPANIMQTVLESGAILKGVTIDVVPFREYVQGDLAPHLIGNIGPIYAEEWEEYKNKGYSYSDKVGKSGIEKLAEEYLHGTDGLISYKIDAKGNILSSEITKAPIPGKTIMLTIDKSLQRTAQDALKNVIDSMQATGGTVTGGAAVIMNIKSGDLLMSATYPSYDLRTYSKDYEALAADKKGLPLTNRAFQGIYPPGSTIKPVVAIAAMENSLVDKTESIICLQKYKLFDDFQPSCMHRHGAIALKDALSKSCNYYFFELGRRVGAMDMTDYFKKFGLGVKTGVDIGDSVGLLVEPESDGLGGNTLQIAIGQMNAFTPLQLTSYVSTLANEGTRYKANLIDKIVSYDMKETYKETEPSAIENFSIDKNIINAVKEGMLSVTEDGTGSAVFKNYGIKVGGKTGTSQVTGKADHSVFIAFAPFDNPEIAMTVVLEHGASTYNVTNVAKTIMDAYFYSSEVTVDNSQPFAVLP
ncbi:MAG: hypothetical protein IJP21_04750 [Clostridia bacterium]|nr:hypothetical protein [Clostridia bacterium]